MCHTNKPALSNLDKLPIKHPDMPALRLRRTGAFLMTSSNNIFTLLPQYGLPPCLKLTDGELCHMVPRHARTCYLQKQRGCRLLCVRSLRETEICLMCSHADSDTCYITVCIKRSSSRSFYSIRKLLAMFSWVAYEFLSYCKKSFLSQWPSTADPWRSSWEERHKNWWQH